MRAAIIDDREDDRAVLFRELDSVLREKGYTVENIDTFTGGEEFLESYEKGKYDLIFFDIYMEGMNGIQAASEVRKSDRDVRLVFVTTSNDFAAESYSLRADYYLLKPFVHDDIVKALTIIDLADYERQRVVTFADGSTCLLHDILYTEYFNHKVIVYLKGARKKKVRAIMTCTKGMIVNLEYVRRIEDGMIQLEEKKQVPVSRRRMAEIRRAHAEYLFRQVRQ